MTTIDLSNVLFRPEGDDIEEIYGKYMSIAEIRQGVLKGQKYEVLCKDGLNYIVEVKAFDAEEIVGHFHFPGWGVKYDYKGSFEKLYIVKENTYTKGLLAGKNAYQTTEADGGEEITVKTTAKRVLKNAPVEGAMAKRTRYDNDFLSKPRLSLSKRKRRDSSIEEAKDAVSEEPVKHTANIAVDDTGAAAAAAAEKEADAEEEETPPEEETKPAFPLMLPTYFTESKHISKYYANPVNPKGPPISKSVHRNDKWVKHAGEIFHKDTFGGVVCEILRKFRSEVSEVSVPKEAEAAATDSGKAVVEGEASTESVETSAAELAHSVPVKEGKEDADTATPQLVLDALWPHLEKAGWTIAKDSAITPNDSDIYIAPWSVDPLEVVRARRAAKALAKAAAEAAAAEAAAAASATKTDSVDGASGEVTESTVPAEVTVPAAESTETVTVAMEVEVEMGERAAVVPTVNDKPVDNGTTTDTTAVSSNVPVSTDIATASTEPAVNWQSMTLNVDYFTSPNDLVRQLQRRGFVNRVTADYVEPPLVPNEDGTPVSLLQEYFNNFLTRCRVAKSQERPKPGKQKQQSDAVPADKHGIIDGKVKKVRVRKPVAAKTDTANLNSDANADNVLDAANEGAVKSVAGPASAADQPGGIVATVSPALTAEEEEAICAAKTAAAAALAADEAERQSMDATMAQVAAPPPPAESSYTYQVVRIDTMEAYRTHLLHSNNVKNFKIQLGLTTSYDPMPTTVIALQRNALMTSVGCIKALDILKTQQASFLHFNIDVNCLIAVIKARRQLDKFTREMSPSANLASLSLMLQARQDLDKLFKVVLHPYDHCKTSQVNGTLAG